MSANDKICFCMSLISLLWINRYFQVKSHPLLKFKDYEYIYTTQELIYEDADTRCKQLQRNIFYSKNATVILNLYDWLDGLEKCKFMQFDRRRTYNMLSSKNILKTSCVW